MDARAVIEHFNLEPLEGEGGYFRQTWTTGEDRAPLGSAILYLITPDSWSALHRLTHDEIFHFYLGDPCRMVLGYPDVSVECVTLGQDIENGERVQHVVPKGAWQGTKLATGGAWALLGTTMAPGYTPECFELATPQAISGFPKDSVSQLTPYLP